MFLNETEIVELHLNWKKVMVELHSSKKQVVVELYSFKKRVRMENPLKILRIFLLKNATAYLALYISSCHLDNVNNII
jgi:hypothetical protein